MQAAIIEVIIVVAVLGTVLAYGGSEKVRRVKVIV